MFQGLSTDQAPPISVPFRFFLTAPLFGILIAMVFFSYPIEEILNRYSPIAVGVTHLFTLGILAMVMFGALQQMLPVLAGAVIPRANLFANVVHTNLTIGTLLLSGGFIYGKTWMLSVGAVMLTLAFATFFIVIIKLLFKVKYLTSTVNAMKLFSVTGAITALLGLHLVSGYITENILSTHYKIVDIHVAFALFGFAFILVMGVAFQVIPMFYVAKDFPKWLQNKFPRVVLGMLVLFALFTFINLDTLPILTILEILTIVFSVYGIISLNNRRRPVFDVTLWYWKLSLASLVVGMVMLLCDINMYMSIMIISFGFLYALLQGMIYKIIPFLAWFHLSSKGHFDIPTLRDFIKEFEIKIQFYVFVSSLVFFILSTLFGKIFLLTGAGLFIVSNILFLVNMIKAILAYSKIVKTDPMAAFK